MDSRFHLDQVSSIYSMLFTSAAEGLVVVNGTGDIQLVNPRMTMLFGHDMEAMLGQPIEMLLPDALRSGHRAHRDRYQRSPVERSMGAGLELMGMRKDGSLFPVEVSLNHFLVEGERFVMALVTDVTKRRRAEKELQRTNAELEERVEERTAELVAVQRELRDALMAEKALNALKSRFVSTASHEFRTPLSTIMSSIDLIGRYAQEGGTEKIGKHVDRVRAKVRELTSMLNEFLSLDKLEQGMVNCHPVDVDVVHQCIELIEELRGLAKPGQEIYYDHQGEERMVYQDKQMLNNILSNLLSNAIKYSPEGKRIDLITRLVDGQLSIRVKDEGIGIPMDEQEHLFERFFRAKNAFTVQGTGLGLNIVRKYLDLMGGDIRFTSVPGEGTLFTAELPQRHAHEDHTSDRG